MSAAQRLYDSHRLDEEAATSTKGSARPVSPNREFRRDRANLVGGSFYGAESTSEPIVT